MNVKFNFCRRSYSGAPCGCGMEKSSLDLEESKTLDKLLGTSSLVKRTYRMTYDQMERYEHTHWQCRLPALLSTCASCVENARLKGFSGSADQLATTVFHDCIYQSLYSQDGIIHLRTNGENCWTNNEPRTAVTGAGTFDLFWLYDTKLYTSSLLSKFCPDEAVPAFWLTSQMDDDKNVDN